MQVSAKQFDVMAYFKPIYPRILLYSFVINILSLVFPIVMLQVYDRIIPNQSTDTLIFLMLGVVSALFFEFILRLARATLSAWSDAQFEYEAGTRSFHQLLNSQLYPLEKEGTATHLERLNALFALKDFYTGQAAQAAFDFPFVIAFMLMIAYISGVLIIVPMVIITVFVLCTFMLNRIVKKRLAKRKSLDKSRSDFILEVLTGMHTVKALALEAQMLRRYENCQQESAPNDVTIGFAGALNNAVNSVISQGGVAMMVGFGALQVIAGQLTIGGLAACTLLIARSLQPISRAMGLWTKYQEVQFAQQKLDEVMSLTQESDARAPESPVIVGEINIQNVSFRYDSESEYLFKNLDFQVKPGQMVVVTGGDRSGRRTFLSMLMGLVQPESGNITLGGCDLAHFEPASIRQQIAYLPQNGILFSGTLLENITMFRSEYQQEAIKIAKVLGLEEVFSALADGYDTVIDDSFSYSLPHGIKQRIAIARALMLPKPIILFLDANNGIGKLANLQFMREMIRRKGQSTMVLVTEQVRFLDIADKVYELRNGLVTLMRDQTQDGASRREPCP